MNKNITIIGINYYPEDSAIGLYTSQLATYLSENGFNVTVITGFPYYPAWKIDKSYCNKKTFLKERSNNITVYRYKQYVPKKPTFLKRILHLVDFTFGSLVHVFKIKQTDLVLCIVPFTSTIIPAKLLAKMKKANLWIHIQDFELDAAVESNLVEKNNFLFKVVLKIEKLLLHRADAISTISIAMLDKVKRKTKNIPNYLLPNWVDVDKINPEKAKKHPYLKSDKFKILYSGNIGEKQDWDFFIKFAKQLKAFKNIELILVGDGAKKDKIIPQLKELSYFKYYKPVAYQELSDLLCSADVHILFQKENSIDTVMPSKILAMMASQKPSIITGNLKSEVMDVIQKSKGGFYLKSDDLNGVLSALENLITNQKLANTIGVNARKYVSNQFFSGKILSEFKRNFDKIIENSN
ncbi:colanic acid biosynthesis glycosyltransferase WcaI [Aureibaculum marinum]|uniref:Colanic acid biosynthesis glycosyltransferase WcaI n=1 Tax=Aureibaculum marinum TaxID=2487930 RepID=A0A3N4NMA9_9FLAO|nr:WcaI family glycosyltransferase [Aureibaculum marinum]RPD97512.1 colanic acid biosynthesis glycosyltransferase WcaI [Aureibaculum marinum]